MRQKGIAAIIVGLALVTGCSSATGTFSANAAQRFHGQAPDTGRLVVMRAAHPQDRGVLYAVEIDGVLVARTAGNDYFELDLPTGEHFVAVYADAPAMKRNISFHVVRMRLGAGEVAYLRLQAYAPFSEGAGRVLFSASRISTEAATAELGSTSYARLN